MEMARMEAHGPRTMEATPMPTAWPVVPPGSGRLNIMMTKENAANREISGLATIGPDNPSLYLLISEAHTMQPIQADIAAEVQVQLGVGLRALAAADARFDGSEDAFARDPDRPVTLITLDHWLPKLVTALDRNVVL